MKIVVAGYGSTGDTVPLLALAGGLQRAGHQAVLVADEGARTSASELGLDFRELAGSSRSVVTEGTNGFAEMMATGRVSPKAIIEFGRFHSREWIETMSDATEGADAIVCSALGLHHAASVAQDRRIPLIGVQLQPSLPTRDYPPPVSGLTHAPRWLNRPLATAVVGAGDLSFSHGVNVARRELGLPRLKIDWNQISILLAWSGVLLPKASDWTHPDTALTGDWYLPTSPQWQAPAGLTEFLSAGDPPVYVGFGSMGGFDNQTLRDALLEGLAGRRVLLSAGWAELTNTELPGDVHPVGYVPHGWLFPQCAAVVHHCGAGTSHQAARSGVPSIPMPFIVDQPFWAGRLHGLGIASRPLDPRKLDVAAVRVAVAEATSEDVRNRASQVAHLMAAEPDGVSVAIDKIEQVVGP